MYKCNKKAVDNIYRTGDRGVLSVTNTHCLDKKEQKIAPRRNTFQCQNVKLKDFFSNSDCRQ
jgi:hypothetical protein